MFSKSTLKKCQTDSKVIDFASEQGCRHGVDWGAHVHPFYGAL